MRTSATTPTDLALVLGGGGARAAYQAGVMGRLARYRPELRFPIITGVSAGAEAQREAIDAFLDGDSSAPNRM